MKRYLEQPVLEDLKSKMVLVGGPGQVGKTTLSLNLVPKKYRYFNWDILEDREFLLKQHFPEDYMIPKDNLSKRKVLCRIVNLIATVDTSDTSDSFSSRRRRDNRCCVYLLY